jgi:hypothetical protein
VVHLIEKNEKLQTRVRRVEQNDVLLLLCGCVLDLMPNHFGIHRAPIKNGALGK